MKPWRRGFGVHSTLVSFLLLLLLASPAADAADLPVDANSLRGVWLERFTRFIDWPTAHRVHDSSLPFELCVLADADFATLLNTLYAKQAIKGKAVRVHALTAPPAPSVCDLLFFASAPAATRDALLEQARLAHTLVVSASPGFAEAGSHINLYEEDGYLRFEINVDATQQAGLTVSSHLLKIARVVRQKGAR